MKVTDRARSLIVSGLRKHGISHSELAKRMNLSKSWASRLLSGGIKTLSDDHVARIQSILDIKFVELIDSSAISGVAAQLSKLSEADRDLDRVLTALLDMAVSRSVPFIPRYFETKEMSGLGQEIIKIAFANDDKPGKVAREVLRLVSEKKPKPTKK